MGAQPENSASGIVNRGNDVTVMGLTTIGQYHGATVSHQPRCQKRNITPAAVPCETTLQEKHDRRAGLFGREQVQGKAVSAITIKHGVGEGCARMA